MGRRKPGEIILPDNTIDQTPSITVTNEVSLRLKVQSGYLAMGYAYFHNTATLADLERLAAEARKLFGREADDTAVTIKDSGIRIGGTKKVEP